jgi:ribosome-associated protein
MDIRKLQRVIVDGLEDVKAQNIVVFNTEHLSPLFERVIIASGTSNRQTKSLAASVRDAVKAAGEPPPRVEGEANGEWIIVDCGAAVVHVMQPSFRDYYHLEELWGDKPVKMKLDGGDLRSARSAAPSEPVAKKTAAKTAGSRPSAKPARAPAPKAAAPARAPAARKAAAGRTGAARTPTPRVPAAKKPVTRTVGVKRTPLKATASTTARSSTARSAPAKKTSAKKTSAEKAPAKKAPARKAPVRR